jgi:hypothetical protein
MFSQLLLKNHINSGSLKACADKLIEKQQKSCPKSLPAQSLCAHHMINGMYQSSIFCSRNRPPGDRIVPSLSCMRINTSYVKPLGFDMHNRLQIQHEVIMSLRVFTRSFQSTNN